MVCQEQHVSKGLMCVVYVCVRGEGGGGGRGAMFVESSMFVRV